MEIYGYRRLSRLISSLIRMADMGVYVYDVIGSWHAYCPVFVLHWYPSGAMILLQYSGDMPEVSVRHWFASPLPFQ